MRESLGIYPLKNCRTGNDEDAELFFTANKQNTDDFELKWKPLMEQRVENLDKGETASSVNVEDIHWKWEDKIQTINSRIDFESFAVECNGETQGLMIVCNTKRARVQSELNKHLIYIELISSAPWNRRGFTDNPLYKGVGPLLLAAAISLSVDEEFKGRIGLHSLPQSESWYENTCNMTDLGLDLNYSGSLKYFEMTPGQAQAYIQLVREI